MGSILQKDLGLGAIDTKVLKKFGFRQITWGRPKSVVVIGDPKKPFGPHKRKLIFDDCQYCWELFDDKYDKYYEGLIYYYPEEFDAYVTPFQGDWKGKNPKHPAGYAYITIDNVDEDWYRIIKIDNTGDLDMAIHIMKEMIDERNKQIFG